MLAIRNLFLTLFLFLLSPLCVGETLSDGEDVDTFVERHIANSDVMVFAKSYCPYCRHTRELLKSLYDENGGGWTLDIVDLDLMEDFEDGPHVSLERIVE